MNKLFMNNLNIDEQNSGEKKYFIHFETSEKLKYFLRETKLPIGHKCCGNTGAHLIGVSSYEHVNKLKRDFETAYNSSNYSKTYECPVCMKKCQYNKRYKLSCKHNFCSICINAIKNHPKLNNCCPICRKNF